VLETIEHRTPGRVPWPTTAAGDAYIFHHPDGLLVDTTDNCEFRRLGPAWAAYVDLEHGNTVLVTLAASSARVASDECVLSLFVFPVGRDKRILSAPHYAMPPVLDGDGDPEGPERNMCEIPLYSAITDEEGVVTAEEVGDREGGDVRRLVSMYGPSADKELVALVGRMYDADPTRGKYNALARPFSVLRMGNGHPDGADSDDGP
jgi:hypothetical protein